MKKCFVIMPFSKTSNTHTESYWTDMFNVVKGIMSDLGYECSRSKEVPVNMVKYIIQEINSSDIVVAILTDYNPNVWYELGVRHSLRRGTIMLIERGQHLPFDISNYGVIHYVDNHSFTDIVREKIMSFLNELNNTEKNDSPVSDSLDKIHRHNVHIGFSNMHLTDMHDVIRKAKNISILFNTGKSFLGTYREDLTTAIRDNACKFKIIISSKSNIAFKNQYSGQETVEEKLFRESLCWGTPIKEEIDETIGIAWRIVEDLKKSGDSVRGSIVLKTSFAVQTGSILIVDNLVKYTPYLPTKHSRDSVSFFCDSETTIEAERFHDAFNSLWDSDNSVNNNYIDKTELAYPT